MSEQQRCQCGRPISIHPGVVARCSRCRRDNYGPPNANGQVGVIRIEPRGHRPVHRVLDYRRDPTPPPGQRLGIGQQLENMLGCSCRNLPLDAWNRAGRSWCDQHRDDIARTIALEPKASISVRGARRLVDLALERLTTWPRILKSWEYPLDRPEKRWQFVIKSMLRWECTERLVRSIRRWYPQVEILIADDSFEELPDQLPPEIERVIRTPGVYWYQIEYDYGLAASRQFLAETAWGHYVVNLDDDFVLLEDSHPDRLIEILDNDRTVDCACGQVRMDGLHAKSWEGHFHRANTLGKRRLTMKPLESPWERVNDTWYRETDLGWNYHALRRSTAIKHPRDPQFKIAGEHLDFFLGLKDSGCRSVVTPQAIVGHYDHKPAAYVPMRRRQKRFYQRLMEKWEMPHPLNHHSTLIPGINPLDVARQSKLDQLDRPNLVVLTAGHTGSSVLMRMLYRLGWAQNDADDEFGESVSVRQVNIDREFHRISATLEQMEEPWAIKDPRFCETLRTWIEPLAPYRPTLLWLTRDPFRVVQSYEARGEDTRRARVRLFEAPRLFDEWKGPKLQLDYDQLRQAVSMFALV